MEKERTPRSWETPHLTNIRRAGENLRNAAADLVKLGHTAGRHSTLKEAIIAYDEVKDADK